MRRGKIAVPFVVFGIVAAASMGLLTFGLWNALVPGIWGLPAISFWQALGLFALSRVLFGRFGGWAHRVRFAGRWKGFTPEERERIRASMRSGCQP